MTKKQAKAEMKYRLAVLLLNDLSEKDKIKILGFLYVSYFSNSRIIKRPNRVKSCKFLAPLKLNRIRKTPNKNSKYL